MFLVLSSLLIFCLLGWSLLKARRLISDLEFGLQLANQDKQFMEADIAASRKKLEIATSQLTSQDERLLELQERVGQLSELASRRRGFYVALKESPGKKQPYYFVLRALNHKDIARGENYHNRADRDKTVVCFGDVTIKDVSRQKSTRSPSRPA